MSIQQSTHPFYLSFPEYNLQPKPSDAEKKRIARNQKRKEKKIIEQQWSERDSDAMLSTRQSLSQRQAQRLMLNFESNPEA